ncbi:MAG: tetratricopeptide repeat protein [Bacteroidota bacterium]
MLRFIVLILCVGTLTAAGQRPAQDVLDGLVREGYQLMQEQKFDEAREKLTKAITASGLQESQDFHALYFRAVCNFYLEDPKAAIEDVSLYLTRFPDSARPYLLRATCYRNLDDIQGQLRDLDLALSKQPEEGEEVDPQIYRWRGGIYLELQKYDSAAADINRSLAINVDPEGLAMKGFVQYNQGRYDSALVSVNQAIELDYTYLSSYLYGSSFCLQEGDYRSALVYADLGLRLDDSNYRLWFYRGISLIETDRIDKGCSALNKAFYNGIDEAGDYLSEYCYKLDR